MEKRVTAKEFDFKSVSGLTMNQMLQHYKLYEGYVNKINQIWDELDDIEDFSDSNSTYSTMRSLMLGQSYAVDGVKLHELYFENICGGGKGIPCEIYGMIERDFGSYERWLKFFKSAGMSMRGWVILGVDDLDGKLHIYGLDAHDVGAVWNCRPLLVLDVYEHAYMIDFGVNRKKYLDAFIENINWEVVNKRAGEAVRSVELRRIFS